MSGVTKVIEKDTSEREDYKIYNIGNNIVETLENFISTIEKAMQKIAIKEMLGAVVSFQLK